MDSRWWLNIKKIVNEWITYLSGSAHRLLIPSDCHPSRKQSIVIIVEGIIGAGKSTLVKNLSQVLEKKGYSVCQILEPVDYWREMGVLEKMYRDPARFSFDFQVCAYLTRLVDINRAVASNPHADIFLLERSTESGKLFAPNFWNLIDPVEKVLLSYMCENLAEFLSLDLTKAHIIYFNPSLSKCMERVTTRNREEEVRSQHFSSDEPTVGKPKGVTKEYQSILSHTHNTLLLTNGSNVHESILRPIYDLPDSVIEIGQELADIDADDESYEEKVLIPIINRLALH